jgi:hypothetical protein
VELYTSEYTTVDVMTDGDGIHLLIQDKFDTRYLQLKLVGKDLLKEIYDKIGEIL